METIQIIIAAYIFIVGSMLGSFINATLYRVPNKKSIVLPRSACPGCDTVIKWYNLIPVVSYITLGGKCKKCGFKIPIKYLLWEIGTGLFTLGIYLIYVITTR